MRILLCLLFSLGSFSALAADKAAGAKSKNSGFITELSPTWFGCKKNRDCVVIQGVCGEPVAVANAHHEKAIRVLASREGGEECEANPNAGWPLPECKAKKCVLKKVSAPATEAPPVAPSTTSGSGF